MNVKYSLKVITIISIILITILFFFQRKEQLPIVTIANYGPHSSLEASIKGIKDELARHGFIDNKTIKYEITDVGFDPSLIPQMLAKQLAGKPKVIVVMTTPIAQFAKGSIKNIPLVFNVITDPIEAGLIKEPNKPDGNMTGCADKQDLKLLLEFARKLIPHAKKVGLLYSTSEANDGALVKMMQTATSELNMELLAIPIDQSRDIPIRMQNFRGKVDFIYVGTSGPIQPAIPVIAAESKKMGIPVFNSDEGYVVEGMSLASFGVDYYSMGRSAGKLVIAILNNVDVKKLTPIYPQIADHHGFISRRKATELGINIPEELSNIKIVE